MSPAEWLEAEFNRFWAKYGETRVENEIKFFYVAVMYLGWTDYYGIPLEYKRPGQFLSIKEDV